MDFSHLLEFEQCLCLDSAIPNLELKIDYLNKYPTSTSVSAFDEKHLKSLTGPSIGTMESIYWIHFINNPISTIYSLPSYTKFLITHQGIPYPLRSLIYKKLFLFNLPSIPTSIDILFTNFQHSYTTEVSLQILKDLLRTFPNIPFFADCNNINDLSTILNVFANYDVELGYCQGLLFLVGILHYHFKDSKLTFFALISIMELEPQLRMIFVHETMSPTLSLWLEEFKTSLSKLDSELYHHLSNITFETFIYQWWLSFVCSHSDINIINRIFDYCLVEGWKVGLMKISLGLMLANSPILMAINSQDEEIIYQHLLNESKWGIIKNIDEFFVNLDQNTEYSDTQESIISVNSCINHSTLSLNKEQDSIYSDISSKSDYKKPYFPNKTNEKPFNSTCELEIENQNLRLLLKKAYIQVDLGLKKEIESAIDI